MAELPKDELPACSVFLFELALQRTTWQVGQVLPGSVHIRFLDTVI
jgi:hypothetical protein